MAMTGAVNPNAKIQDMTQVRQAVKEKINKLLNIEWQIQKKSYGNSYSLIGGKHLLLYVFQSNI